MGWVDGAAASGGYGEQPPSTRGGMVVAMGFKAI